MPNARDCLSQCTPLCLLLHICPMLSQPRSAAYVVHNVEMYLTLIIRRNIRQQSRRRRPPIKEMEGVHREYGVSRALFFKLYLSHKRTR